MSQPLTLKFLGAPQIICGVEHIEPDTRKAVALLAYLAITGQAQTRDALAALLYPDYDDRHARGALRRTLHALNKILPAEHLRATREWIELSNKPAVCIDVEEFKSLIGRTRNHTHRSIDECDECHGHLEKAIELYRGDFLAGFSLRDSAAFDDWQFFQGEELRSLFAGALTNLSHICQQRGEYEKAIQHTRRWLALDPLVEAAHRELMRCYALSGQRNAALRQYQECVRILEKELGVDPLEETITLYEDILNNHLKQPKNTGEGIQQNLTPIIRQSEPVSPPYRYPLVGRSRESEALVQAYQQHAQNGYFLSLEGEAGIGKTRIAEEFLASIQSQSGMIIKSRCYEGESDLAYSPLADALNSIMPEIEFRTKAFHSLPKRYLSETARLVPALFQSVPDLPPPAPLNDPGAQSMFFEGLRQFILEISRGSVPGVLFLDDLQWSDSATLDFLAYLVRRLPGQPLFLLAAWRNEEFTGYPVLKALLSNAQRSGYARHLKLTRLQMRDVEDLLRTMQNRFDPMPANFGERLFNESEGLPYFLVEYLDVCLQSAEFAEEIMEQEPSWDMPESVRALLRMRLQSVDPLGQQLLATSAVIGRSFDFDTLVFASGRSEIETITGLESLLGQRLIEECTSCDHAGSVMYDFTHDKLRQLAYEETSLSRRRLLHRRVADALLIQQRGHANPGSLESKVAFHFLMTGLGELAAAHLKLAGDHARTLYANRQALQHYQSAIEAGHPDKIELLEAVGDLQTLLGAYQEAHTSYFAALREAGSGFTPPLEHKIARVWARLGEWDQAISSYQKLIEQISPDDQPVVYAQILVDWSLAEFQRGQPGPAQELAHRALIIADRTGATSASIRAHNLLGILARNRLDHGLAKKELKTSLDAASKNQDETSRAAALNNLALVYADTGEVEQAIDLTQQALEISEKLGDLHHSAALHSNLADLFHKTGRADQSMQHMRESVKIFSQIGEHASELNPEIWKLTEW